MVVLGYILSALVMGLILVVLTVSVTRMEWRHYTPEGSQQGIWSAGEQLLDSPIVWTVSFLLLALGSGATAVLALGAIEVPAASRKLALAAVLGVFVVTLGISLAFSTYRLARFRRLNPAQAAGAGGWTVGLLLILAVVVKLVVTG